MFKKMSNEEKLQLFDRLFAESDFNNLNIKEKYKEYLYDSKDRFNSAILNSKSFFLHTKLYNYILENTSFLDGMKGITFGIRIQVLEDGYTEIPLCLECNKKEVKIRKNEFTRFCGNRCAMKSPITKENRAQTNIKLYGAANCFQSKEKMEKAKETMIKRYGVDHPMHSDEIKAKHEQTCKENWGVSNVSQSEEIKRRKEETTLQNYNVKNPFQSETIKNKIKEKWQKLYNVDNISKTSHIKEKISKLWYERNFDETWNKFIKNINHVEPLFSKKDYINSKEKVFKFKCLNCNWEFNAKFNFQNPVKKCPKCIDLKFGKAESEVSDYIISLSPDIKMEINTRDIIPPLELDIYLPNNNLAIEYNGLYWHSEKYKDRDYHLTKTRECGKKGIKLIHIFEDEWVNKEAIVKSRLKNILGLNRNRVYARETVLESIDYSEANAFLEENHIQGKCVFSEAWGLRKDGELLSLMVFGKPRFSKDYDFELIRFCNKLDHVVVGSASKILSHFRSNNRGKSIISYTDRRWSNGALYNKLGFKLERESQPSYWYILNGVRYHRSKFQKHKLVNLLEGFDDRLTEEENMFLHGFDKLWDCGTLVYSI